MTTTTPDLAKIRNATTDDLSLGAEYGHHDPARRQAILDELHTRAVAEFDQARTDDQGYNLQRTGPDSPQEIGTSSLGAMLVEPERRDLNGWAAAVIRDELHTRAAQDGEWRTTVLAHGTEGMLGYLLENRATLHPAQGLTRQAVLDELHGRALAERPAAAPRVPVGPLDRAALAVLKAARLTKWTGEVMHLVYGDQVPADVVADLTARGLIVGTHVDCLYKLTMSGYSLRLRLV